MIAKKERKEGGVLVLLERDDLKFTEILVDEPFKQYTLTKETRGKTCIGVDKLQSSKKLY